MRKKSILTVLILFLCFFIVTPVKAGEYQDSDPDDYITESFDVTVKFDRGHRADVTEVIKVDFIQMHHGITRNIPLAKDRTYEVRDFQAEGFPYKVEHSDNNETIRIGDADKYLKGKQTFVIHYQIEYFKDNNHSYDYLAHNLLPTEWATSIRSSSIELTMPGKVNWDECELYYGPYGQSDPNAWAEVFSGEVEGNTLRLKGKNLMKGYGLTIRNTGLKNGYWSKARTFLERNRGKFNVIAGFSIFFGILAVVLWFLYGRDQRPVETVEFYPPDKMTPVDVGYALDEELEDRELMTLVFYLADKGHLSIEKDGKDEKNFILRKVAEVGDDEPEYVATFFNGLFKKKSSFRTKTVPVSFRKPFDKAKEQAVGAYTKEHGDVFTLSSVLSRVACMLMMGVLIAVYNWVMDGSFDGVYLALFPVAIAGGGMYLAWTGFAEWSVRRIRGGIKLVLGTLIYLLQIVVCWMFFSEYPMGIYWYIFAISLIVIYFFSLIMKKRTDENVRLMGRLNGFRRFIKEAEYDRIKELCDSDPEYFYHILPYASILGLETEWTKHFDRITIPKPGWYLSNGDRFVYSSVWCSHMLRTCTVNGIPSVPSSGGSSGGYSGGFSGGGFSGGGGGGGGGGAW